jgi:hypothetical protein
MPSSASDNRRAVSISTPASLPSGARAESAQPNASRTSSTKLASKAKIAASKTAIWFQQRELLLSVLRQPERLSKLTLSGWDLLIRLARQTHMLTRLAAELRTRDLWNEVPAEVWPTLQSALVLADRHECVVRWEFNRLTYALREIAGPVVLLKGAAYLAAGIPVSQGRIYSDIDLLVPAGQLAEVEKKLIEHGWYVAAIDPRDADYFRAWLHELPPLVHRRRQTVLDVHHTILPRTDKLQVDPAKLLADSIEVPGQSLRVLAPADMVLHSSAHLFRNGDFSHALRDLYDISGLLSHFGQQPGFWKTLVERAEAHNLQLPCFCGLHYAARYFQIEMNDEIRQAMDAWRPGRLRLAILDRLVDRALVPRELDQPDRGRDFALNLLAHWPIPRWKVMFTANFWAKRWPRFGPDADAKPAAKQIVPNREVAHRTYSQAASRGPEKPD